MRDKLARPAMRTAAISAAMVALVSCGPFTITSPPTP